jgi:hypothetical protein
MVVCNQPGNRDAIFTEGYVPVGATATERLFPSCPARRDAETRAGNAPELLLERRTARRTR